MVLGKKGGDIKEEESVKRKSKRHLVQAMRRQTSLWGGARKSRVKWARCAPNSPNATIDYNREKSKGKKPSLKHESR